MELLLVPLLIVANLLGIGMIVPQITRLHRTRVTDGVSAPWVGVSFAMNVGWLSYALNGRLWGLVPVSVGGMLVYLVVALQLRALVGSRILRPLVASAAATSIALLTVLATADWPAVGLALGLAYGPQFGPAALSVIRSHTAVGVSSATWNMAVSEAAIWVVYGLAVADRALIIGGVGGTVVASVILARLASRDVRRDFVGEPSTQARPAPLANT
ncbi:MAG: hypothetical protein ACR2P0_04625 [Acidimicrobiales bacterium]